MKIVFIHYPHVFTDDGQRISIDEICGVPKVGYELVVGADGEYNLKPADINDNECINGVCPIK